MRILDRYIVLEWLKALGLAIGATMAVLLLQDMYSNLGELLTDGAHPREVLKYYGLLLPSFVPAVLPVSQLVALLFAVGNLHRNQEIVAMRAAGLSLGRIARPLWIGGAVLAGLLGWFNAAVVPSTVQQSREFHDNLKKAAASRAHPDAALAIVPQLTFTNIDAHRQWFINRYDPAARRAYGVLINELDADGHDQRAIYAHDGAYDEAAGHWVLNDGRIVTFAPDHSQLRSVPFTGGKTFADLAESPAAMLNLHKDAQDLSLDELEKTITEVPAANPAMNSYAVEYYALLAKPFICLLIVGLAVPLAVAGVRTNALAGASQAIGWFFAYYVVTGMCTHLGNQHYLPAIVAAWLPMALMFGVSLWLFRKAA